MAIFFSEVNATKVTLFEPMKSRTNLIILLFATLILVTVAGFYMAGVPEDKTSKPQAKNAAEARIPPPSIDAPAVHMAAPQPSLTPAEVQKMLQDKARETTELSATEQIVEVIDDAAISYDAKELPKIQPFLTHSDPEVREAAVNGIMVLGDPAGAPMLRAAAKLALTPEEAVALNESAAYLELPSGSMLNMKPKKKK